MSDRELLEKAAKAAGLALTWNGDNPPYPRAKVGSRNLPWNPITDDGDALRLAVKIAATTRVNLVIGSDLLRASADPLADVRRAIVGVAAALGQVAQPANTDSVPGSPGSESTRPDEPKLPESGGIGGSSIGLGAEGEQ